MTFCWVYFHQFCELHPELEHVDVEFSSWLRDIPNDAVSKLPKPKSFSCKRGSVAPLVKVIELVLSAFYTKLKELFFKQNLLKEWLRAIPSWRLSSSRLVAIKPIPLMIELYPFSVFRVWLSYLSLCGFDLKDGFALLSVIATFLK